MRIGGIIKFSLVDYPGKRAAVIFTQGCNFRCPYCHNPGLVEPARFGTPLDPEEIVAFLEKRRGALEAVVISGGEPTLQPDLMAFLDRIKRMGYLTKVDTNGANPHVLKKLVDLRFVNYIAMDIKSSWKHYRKATGVAIDRKAVEASMAILKQGRVHYEFRTTVCRPVCDRKDLEFIRDLTVGAERYRLQRFRPGRYVLNPEVCDKPQFNSEEFATLQSCFQY